MNWLFTSLAAGAALLAAGAAQAQSNDCGVTFGATFNAYTCTDLGTPAGVPAPLGGLTFLNSDTLLIGGAANTGDGEIRSLAVTRGADGHITGLGAASSAYAAAPRIDGGLTFAPNGTLLAVTYNNNRLLEYLPGSTAPDRSVALDDLGIASSTGTLAFVPADFAGAGRLKIASYNGGQFYDVTYTTDPDGLLTLTGATQVSLLSGQPEGLAYVPGANSGFGADGLLVNEYGVGQVGAYDVDALGNPVAGTRRDFLSGLSGAEGAVIDPVTGDFLFSTFNAGNRLLRISGFAAPAVDGVPEPATWGLMLAGFGLVGAGLRSRRRSTAVTYA